MLKRVLEWLHKKEWLIIILAMVVVLRVPSLFEPYWYGDEAIYLTVGHAIDKGVSLYSGIHDNKPPLLYLLAALAGGNQFWFKFIALIWNLLIILVFEKLAEKVFEQRRRPIIISTIVLALLTTTPWWEGNIANAELFFLLPTIGAVSLLWKKQVSLARVAAAGFLLGLGALFKMPAIVEAGVWPLVWLATGEKKTKTKIGVLALFCLLPILLSGIYFWSQGTLSDYLTAAWIQNIPYLSSWQTNNDVGGIFSMKGRAVLLIIMLAVWWGLAKKLGRVAIIIGMWGGLSLFAALLSGRPYPHYLLQTAGVAAIATAAIFEKKLAEKLAGSMVVIFILISFSVYRFYTYPIVGYYGNFISWVWGIKTTHNYYAWFSPTVNTNYEVAGLIKAGTNENDKIFVWGDEPSIYALTQRLPEGKYTAKYHIKDFHAETSIMALLKQQLPKYVISYGNEEELPGLASWLENNYFVEQKIGNATVYKWSRLSLIMGKL